MKFQVTNALLTKDATCKLSVRFQCYPKPYFLFLSFGCKDETHVSYVWHGMTAQCAPICFTSKPAERISIHTNTKGLHPSNTTTYFLPSFKHSRKFR